MFWRNKFLIYLSNLGKGEEFRDLDKMMKRLEHWAHRLYPKLPFDDVMGRISQLGKKKNVQVKDPYLPKKCEKSFG